MHRSALRWLVRANQLALSGARDRLRAPTPLLHRIFAGLARGAGDNSGQGTPASGGSPFPAFSPELILMRIRSLTLAAGLAALCVLCASGQDAAKRPEYAGPTADGFLLPNGWR